MKQLGVSVKRRVTVIVYRAVGLADTEPSRKNRIRNNRLVLVLGERHILCTHKPLGRHSTASVLWRRIRSAGR